MSTPAATPATTPAGALLASAAVCLAGSAPISMTPSVGSAASGAGAAHGAGAASGAIASSMLVSVISCCDESNVPACCAASVSSLARSPGVHLRERCRCEQLFRTPPRKASSSAAPNLRAAWLGSLDSSSAPAPLKASWTCGGREGSQLVGGSWWGEVGGGKLVGGVGGGNVRGELARGFR